MTPQDLIARPERTSGQPQVVRFGIWNETTKTVGGDYLRVGHINLGEVQDLVDAEYRRAGTAYEMRPMWFTGSSYWFAILRLAVQVRGIAAIRAP